MSISMQSAPGTKARVAAALTISDEAASITELLDQADDDLGKMRQAHEGNQEDAEALDKHVDQFAATKAVLQNPCSVTVSIANKATGALQINATIGGSDTGGRMDSTAKENVAERSVQVNANIYGKLSDIAAMFMPWAP